MMATTGDTGMIGTGAGTGRAKLGRRGQVAAVVAGLLLLGGCINLGGGKAPGNLISLSVQPGPSAGVAMLKSTAKPGEALVVFEPQTDRSLSAVRVPVQVNDTSIAYLTDVTWIDHPSRLLRSLLAETIRGRGKRLVFEDDQAEAKGNSRLTGRLGAMGYDARSRSVVVRYDALQQLADGTLKSRRFEAVKKGIAPKGPAVAAALNDAANEVAGQVADWVE